MACPADLVIGNDKHKPSALVKWQRPKATDNSWVKSVRMIHPVGIKELVHHFLIGATKVSYQALDSVGLEAVCSFTVMVNGKKILSRIPCSLPDWLTEVASLSQTMNRRKFRIARAISKYSTTSEPASRCLGKNRSLSITRARSSHRTRTGSRGRSSRGGRPLWSYTTQRIIRRIPHRASSRSRLNVSTIIISPQAFCFRSWMSVMFVVHTQNTSVRTIRRQSAGR